MCGILFSYSQRKYVKNNFENALDLQSHRGPDNKGLFSKNNMFFGHNRLSIIDITENANQPLTNEKNIVLLFNGEIYNYRELQKRYNLSSDFGDTKTLIELYSMIGIEMVYELEGMFAMVIFDPEVNGIWFLRDSFGIKPLYYFQEEGELIIASELKPIINLLETVELNNSYVNKFLSYGFSHDQSTIIQKVYGLEKGNISFFDMDKNKITANFDYSRNISLKYDFGLTQNLKKLKFNIIKSIKLHLVSDVPFVNLLSGGLDSSLVGFYSALHKNVKFLTVKTTSSESLDESDDAVNFVKKIKNKLTKNNISHILVNSNDIDAENILNKLDIPIADSSIIPSYGVFNIAKKHAKVAICGDGGDELFFGYNWYFFALILKVFKLSPKFLQILISKRFSQFSFYKLYAMRISLFDKNEYENKLSDCSYTDYVAEKIKEYQNRYGFFLGLQKFDLDYYLPNDILLKVDRASMLNSVEARVPLLSLRIMPYAFGIKFLNLFNIFIKKFVFFILFRKQLGITKFFNKKRGFNFDLKSFDVNFKPYETYSNIYSKENQELFKEIINSNNKSRIFALYSLLIWTKNNENNLVSTMEK